jgi:UDP-N-acetylglucosamine acyltransferase
MTIHPTAVVDPGAHLGTDVDIGPYAVVEADVEVGHGVKIGAHAVVKSGTRIAERVRVYEGAVLGGDPQDLKFDGAPSFAIIGADSVIREFATVHRSAVPQGVTRVGRNCFVMAYGHVAHDCDIGDEAIIASYAALAGHIHVGRRAFVSGGVVIHQFSRIGELAMIGGGSKVNLDVPPYFIVDGVPARAIGVNVVGLRRADANADDVQVLKKAFRSLYRSKLPLREAVAEIGAMDNPLAERLAEFVLSSRRGICRARRQP